MRFLFFDAAGDIYGEREDAESAKIVHEQMSLQAVFPWDRGKEILRGMRVGVTDGAGVFQVFEIRKVKNNEPGHFQQITGENIAISELTDEFCGKHEWTDITAGAALSPLLTGTGWQIGTNTASNISSGDVSVGNVWNATRAIQSNWNVYILPRIEVNASGIVHKYLDIMPAEGTWQGFRLSLDKNANEVGVTWDDSNLKTALYGFGRETDETPLTFADVTWTATADHPAKPSGQTYIEDPTATSNFGRNGRPRFGFYQNAGITDAATLLQKTWETLKTVSVPDVTVTGAITDLYRLGYKDVPIRLHDTALIEIRPTGVVLQKEIIQYSEDLLDPSQSTITAGTYIPNIIYINREVAKRSGGGRGGASGRDSQSPAEYTTENNTVQIRIDSNGIDSLCVGTGAQLNPDGSLVVDEDGNPVFIEGGENLFSRIKQNKTAIELEVTDRSNADTELDGKISVNADKISLVVTTTTTTSGDTYSVNAASIVAGINNDTATGQSYVTIDADRIKLSSSSTSSFTLDDKIDIDSNSYIVLHGNTIVYGSTSDSVSMVNGDITAQNINISAGKSLTFYGSGLTANTSIGQATAKTIVTGFGTVTESSGQITIPYSTVAHSTAGDNNQNINFNIADMAYYQNHIGIQSTGSWLWDTDSEVYYRTITPNDGQDVDINLPTITATAGNFANHKSTVTVSGPGNHAITTTVVDATNEYTNGVTEGERHFSPAGRVYTRGTSAHYFGSTTIYEANNPVYLKGHPSSETPTGTWYSFVTREADATVTYYSRRSATYYVSGSGTPYYTSTGFSDNYYTYTG